MVEVQISEEVRTHLARGSFCGVVILHEHEVYNDAVDQDSNKCSLSNQLQAWIYERHNHNNNNNNNDAEDTESARVLLHF